MDTDVRARSEIATFPSVQYGRPRCERRMCSEMCGGSVLKPIGRVLIAQMNHSASPSPQ
jgi:hypothetical protein